MKAVDVNTKKVKVLMIQMNRQEALLTIESLTKQLVSGSPNGGRYEKYLEDGRDFSIAVMEDKNNAR